MTGNISVVIPAYNESNIIRETIKALQTFAEIREVIVVDDGSTDGTAGQAGEMGVLVWRHRRNLGKGAALNTGAALASGDIIVFLDADLGSSAREAYKLWEPVLAGEADCIIARFPRARQAGGFGLVKKLAQWGVTYLGGAAVPAVLSGQRALTRAALEAIFPLPGGYGAEVGATIRLLRRGYRIKEVEVSMKHRETGRNWAGFYHRGRQFGHILKALAREAWR
ncbi:MAG TPA: glycosyltransferase family 2 protein [Clostridia bacterium]|nr:glycosyltransferase family 2 protein [Clostridia bacterium]